MSLADKMSGKGKAVSTINETKVIKVDTSIVEQLIEQRVKDLMAFMQKEIAKWNSLTFTTLENAIKELKTIQSNKPIIPAVNTNTEKPIDKPVITETIDKAFTGIDSIPQYIPEVLEHIRKRIDISKVDKKSWITGFVSAYASIRGKVRGRPLSDEKLNDIANTIYENIVSTKTDKVKPKEAVQGVSYWTKMFDLGKGELQGFIDGMIETEVEISDLRTKEGRNFVFDQLGIDASETTIEDRKGFFAFLENCLSE